MLGYEFRITASSTHAARWHPARNRLTGTVEEITLGGGMAHVVVRVGSNMVESVITRRSAEEMKLKKGDKVTAIIKSTEVMLEKE